MPDASDDAKPAEPGGRTFSHQNLPGDGASPTDDPVEHAVPRNPLEEIPPDEAAATPDEARWFQELRQRKEQINQLYSYMDNRFPEAPKCPWCGHDEYTIREPLALQPQVGGVFSRSVFPYYPVTCTTCGYTFFFNAMVAGVPKLPDVEGRTGQEQGR